MGKRRGLVGLVFARLEALVGAAQALTSEAYVVTFECGLGLDRVDAEVLRDRLVLANRHLGAMLCALDDDLDDWSPESAARVAEIATRYRPAVPRCDDARTHVAYCVGSAERRAGRAHRMVVWIFRASDSTVARSMWTATAHLGVAAYLLSGAKCRDEMLIESLAEHRRIVMERRGWAGGEGAAV